MCIADDIMVVGYKDDHSDHDLTLIKLLQTAKQNNVKLNFEKLQYKKHEVTFFGENCTTPREKPDLKKIEAIVKKKQLRTRKRCRHFWEWCNTCKSSHHNLPVLAEPLWDLIKTNSPYIGVQNILLQWMQSKNRCESTHLKILWSEGRNCSTNRCQLQRTWSSILLQDGHPIYFVSKSLTDAKKGYVAIKLEALAVS